MSLYKWYHAMLYTHNMISIFCTFTRCILYTMISAQTRIIVLFKLHHYVYITHSTTFFWYHFCLLELRSLCIKGRFTYHIPKFYVLNLWLALFQNLACSNTCSTMCPVIGAEAIKRVGKLAASVYYFYSFLCGW